MMLSLNHEFFDKYNDKESSVTLFVKAFATDGPGLNNSQRVQKIKVMLQP